MLRYWIEIIFHTLPKTFFLYFSCKNGCNYHFCFYKSKNQTFLGHPCIFCPIIRRLVKGFRKRNIWWSKKWHYRIFCCFRICDYFLFTELSLSWAVVVNLLTFRFKLNMAGLNIQKISWGYTQIWATLVLTIRSKENGKILFLMVGSGGRLRAKIKIRPAKLKFELNLAICF